MLEFRLPDEAMEGMLGEFRQIEEPEPPEPAEGVVDDGGAAAAAGEPVGDGGPGEGGEGVPAPAAAPPAGRSLSDDEWQAWETYRQLDQRLQTDPAFAERFRQVFTPPEPPPAAPPPARAPEPAADSYLAQDPAWQRLQGELAQMRAEQARHAALLNEQRQAESAAVLRTVEGAFRNRHSLDDATFAKVRQAANAYAGVLPGMSARGVPLDQALDEVLETAYWSLPEMREAEQARLAADTKARGQRKAKAGSLAGSSGSVPRQQRPPQNEAERRAAMIEAIAQGISGGAVE